MKLRETIGLVRDDTGETHNKNIYFPFRFELTIVGNMLLRGTKIICNSKKIKESYITIRNKIPSIQGMTNGSLDYEIRDSENDIHHHILTPTFKSVEYEVLERNENEISISSNGKLFRRNVEH